MDSVNFVCFLGALGLCRRVASRLQDFEARRNGLKEHQIDWRKRFKDV